MDPAEAARYFYNAGFRGSALVTMVAVAIGESGLNPNATGDTSLQNRTWGPSLGLAQIRSLNAQRGTGQSRDANRLRDPAFNAAAAYEISGGGRNFRPWAVFTSGKYRSHLGRAQAAVSQMLSGGGQISGGLQGQSVAGLDFLAQFGQAPMDPVDPVIRTMDNFMAVLVGGTRTGGNLGVGSAGMSPLDMMGDSFGTSLSYGGGGSDDFAPAGGSAGELPIGIPNPAPVPSRTPRSSNTAESVQRRPVTPTRVRRM